jgi:hypothetical protein
VSIDPLELGVAIAKAFDLVVPEVIAFVKQRHPELRAAPMPSEASSIDAEIDAEIARRSGR